MHCPIGPQCSGWAQTDSRTADEIEQVMWKFIQAVYKYYNDTDHVVSIDIVNEDVQGEPWKTDESGTGGQTITAPAPIDIMPLYVKAGSIIPMGPYLQYATEKPADPIELRIYPDADGKFELYEDENDDYNYEKGKYALILFIWNDKSKTLTIGDRRGEFNGMLKHRTFHTVLVNQTTGTGVGISKSSTPVQYNGKRVSVSMKQLFKERRL